MGHRRRQWAWPHRHRGSTRSTRTDPTTPPRIVILVQLEEGTRLVSNLVDPPHDGPYDDLPVTVDFRDDRGARTPFFRVGDVTGTIVAGIGADRVLEGVGTQRDAARRGSEPRRDPRRRPHAGRHRRHGHLHRRRQRRAGADAQPRARAGDLVVARAGWRHGRVRVGPARGRRGGIGARERGARVPRVQRAVRLPLRATARAASGPPPLDWYRNFGVDTPAKMYALWFRRYMHAFGATNEDFGRYTVSARRYAATNPKAWFYERPITLDDHQASRWIVEPVLRLLRLLPGERRRGRPRRDPGRSCNGR